MTVSFLFGWQHILTGLVLLIVLAAIFLLVLAAGRGGRSEWQRLPGRPLARAPDLPPGEDDAPRTRRARSAGRHLADLPARRRRPRPGRAA